MAARPTADDVARTIVWAAGIYGEDPFKCVQGVPDLQCRRAAMCALEMVFPFVGPRSLARMVGYGSAWNADLSKRPREERQRRSHVAKDIANALRDLHHDANSDRLRDEGRIPMRRHSVPGHLCADLTSDLMGDPPSGRAAIASASIAPMDEQ